MADYCEACGESLTSFRHRLHRTDPPPRDPEATRFLPWRLVAETPDARLPDDLDTAHCRICEQAWTARRATAAHRADAGPARDVAPPPAQPQEREAEPGQILLFGDATI